MLLASAEKGIRMSLATVCDVQIGQVMTTSKRRYTLPAEASISIYFFDQMLLPTVSARQLPRVGE